MFKIFTDSTEIPSLSFFYLEEGFSDHEAVFVDPEGEIGVVPVQTEEVFPDDGLVLHDHERLILVQLPLLAAPLIFLVTWW